MKSIYLLFICLFILINSFILSQTQYIKEVKKNLLEASSKLTIQNIGNDELLIVINPELHINYGFMYPVTYLLRFSSSSNPVFTYKKYNSNQNWILINEKTTNEFFNGIEAARYDHENNLAIISVAFDPLSDSLFIKVIDHQENSIPLEYLRISKYYDNRDAVVTTTADDWCKHTINQFNKAVSIFRNNNLWLSCGIITDSETRMDAYSWNIVQKQLDSGYVEAVSHSRHHLNIPYDCESEIVGSKTDIINNLNLPCLFRKNEKEYIYAYLNPYGGYNNDIDFTAGSANYLITRRAVGTSYELTVWNEGNNIYERTMVAFEYGNNERTIEFMNNLFNIALNQNGVYHFFIHPKEIETSNLWNVLSLHLDFISNRKNIWYSSFGHLYLYHFLEDGDYNPLYVEVSSFSSEVIENYIKLYWTTETEVNNYGFEIERKIKGSNWEKIGFVQGKGNSNCQQNYLFFDNNPLGCNKLLYRLKQIDADGQFNYSKEIEVDLLINRFELFQNYPNPFNPVTKIKYSIFKDALVTLKIFDILGREVAVLINEKKTPGNFTVDFNAAGLSNGVYIYTISCGDFHQSKKMVLVK